MRNRLLFFTPFILLAGLHVACGAKDGPRAAFEDMSLNQDSGPSAPTFDNVVVDAGGDAAQGCSETTTEILQIPVVIEFAVDESGSMDGSGSSDKWGAARDALLAAFEDMKNANDKAMFVGVLRWSTAVGKDVDPGPIADPSHYSDLVDAMDTTKAGGGGTNMDIGLAAAYKAAENFVAPAGFVKDSTKRAVVLVSDGVPLDSVKPVCKDMAAKKLTEAPPKGPIVTFAVGIGPFPSSSTSTYDPKFMSEIAIAGGTAPPYCSPTSLNPAGLCHFQITPAGSDNLTAKQALIDAINKIRALTASCEFTFTTNAHTDLSNVTVEITDKDGTKTVVPKDDSNGWAFDDEQNPTKVILHGDACSSSTGTLSGRVDVVIGCRGAN